MTSTERKPKSQNKSQESELYKSFLQELGHPPTLSIHEELLSEYQNFDPKKIMSALIKRAAFSYTSPDEFQEEMRILLSYPYERSWEKDLLELHVIELRQKYSVTSGNEPDLVTYSRLSFMFPQYSTVLKAKTYEITDYIRVPGLFYPAEFAGLIPSVKIVSETVQNGLKILHLYVLSKQQADFTWSTPIGTLQKLVKKRIEIGLLSDEQRVSFLQSKGILTSQKELAKEAKMAFEYITKNCCLFMNQIQRDFID